MILLSGRSKPRESFTEIENQKHRSRHHNTADKKNLKKREFAGQGFDEYILYREKGDRYQREQRPCQRLVETTMANLHWKSIRRKPRRVW